jgi:hypothetical protein
LWNKYLACVCSHDHKNNLDKRVYEQCPYFGFQLPDILDAVEGYTLLSTDLNGWIHISTDGEQLWVEAERENNK